MLPLERGLNQFACEMRVAIMHTSETFDFRPVDAMPRIEERDINDLRIFADAQLVRTKEVIVMPDSVPELMTRILELQHPEQALIRERSRKRAAREGLDSELLTCGTQFHAQILTVR